MFIYGKQWFLVSMQILILNQIITVIIISFCCQYIKTQIFEKIGIKISVICLKLYQ